MPADLITHGMIFIDAAYRWLCGHAFRKKHKLLANFTPKKAWDVYGKLVILPTVNQFDTDNLRARSVMGKLMKVRSRRIVR